MMAFSRFLVLACAGLVPLCAFAQKEVSGEQAVEIARNFVKDFGVRGDLKLTGCRRLDFKTQPKGFVWHLYMVRAPGKEFSVGISPTGKLIWFEPSAGGYQETPKVDAAWRQKALLKANVLLRKLKPKWTVSQPSDDLMRFAENNLFFPISVNGKRFVGEIVGYQFQFAGDLELTRFARQDDVPPVNTTTPTVTPDAALKEARASLELEVKDAPFKGHRFQFGKPSLVYYYRWEGMPAARLCWYFKVDAQYDRGHSIGGAQFGVVVDAVTGKRIKTPTQLS